MEINPPESQICNSVGPCSRHWKWLISEIHSDQGEIRKKTISLKTTIECFILIKFLQNLFMLLCNVITMLCAESRPTYFYVTIGASELWTCSCSPEGGVTPGDLILILGESKDWRSLMGKMSLHFVVVFVLGKFRNWVRQEKFAYQYQVPWNVYGKTHRYERSCLFFWEYHLDQGGRKKWKNVPSRHRYEDWSSQLHCMLAKP